MVMLRIMPRPTLLNTTTINLRTLLSNGKRYEVPPYQRDYSWGEEQWDDLWLDLEDLERGEKQHYMGALVLQEYAPDLFRIIDGQQRLATLSILVIASLRCLEALIERGIEPDDNRQRSDGLRAAFLGSKNPVTLQTSPKLVLNHANRRFYEGTLLQLRRPASVSALPPGELPLWRSFEYFRAKLDEKFVRAGDGTGLTNFIYEIMATGLLFIQVVVEDEVGAYTVFETLNARRLELTAGDLLENYLLSVVHPVGQGDLEAAQQRWLDIADKVEPRKLPVFLRQYLNSRHEFVRQERVFKSLRAQVTRPEQVFTLLDELSEAAILHDALEDPTHPLWSEMPDAVEAVRHLRLYQVVQYRPLALAAWRALSRDDLARILRYCDVISFRYSIIGQRNPSKLEYVYSDIAIQVSRGALRSAAAVKAALQPVYVSDDDFREQFARCALNAGGARKKLVRYILCALEKQIHKFDIDFETTNASIEHVLPEHPAPAWQAEFPGDVHARYVHRLGNYLLLEPKLNRERAANGAVEEKRAAYAQSQYPSTRAFDWETWNPRTIEERQAQLARAATAVWRLP
jgi:hypothetical protein